MSGKLKGSIEHVFPAPSSYSGSVQPIFKVMFDAFSSGDDIGIQRIAYNTGSKPSGATTSGTGWYDESNPFGEGAFACFRFLSASNPFDVLIQWTGATQANTAPGNPARMGGSTTATNTVAWAMCARTDTSSSWNGTTLNNGNDVKGTPVWTSGSSRIAVFPRSNAFGGSYATSREDMSVIYGGGFTTERFQLLLDKDGVYYALDTSNDSAYDRVGFAGVYTPLSGVTPSASLVMWNLTTTLPIVGSSPTTIGSIAGATNTDGGISHPFYVDTKNLVFDRLTTVMTNTNTTPNNAYPGGSTRYDDYPIYVVMYEASASYGLCGYIDFVREIFGTNVHDRNTSGDRVVIGTLAATTNVKHSIPFHTGTVPGTGVTRAGVQFSSPLWQ